MATLPNEKVPPQLHEGPYMYISPIISGSPFKKDACFGYRSSECTCFNAWLEEDFHPVASKCTFSIIQKK